MMSKKVVLLSLAAPVFGADIVLENFAAPIHSWKSQNDPVMGGQSTGTFEIKAGVGVFDGEVVDVPSLSAPGFITVQGVDGIPYADVSSCSAFYMKLKSDTAYEGYRFSVGTSRPPEGFIFAQGHKAPAFGADLLVGETTIVTFPFNEMSNLWDGATGDIITTCEENDRYCITAEILKDIKTVAVWGEGVGGKVHLEIDEIGATGCPDKRTAPVVEEVAVLAKFDAKVDVLVSFDGASETTYEFAAVNDPVMGGASNSTLLVDVGNGVAVWEGQVVDVPGIEAPGYCSIRSVYGQTFPDITGSKGMQVTVRPLDGSELTVFKLTIEAEGGVALEGSVAGVQVTYAGNLDELANESGSAETLFVAWSDFVPTWRGAVQVAPPVDTLLKGIMRVGFGTKYPSVNGKFVLEIESIEIVY